MLKFTYISKELFQTIQSSLVDFKEIKNQFTGGDDDFVLLDETRKEFSWFENGSIGISDLVYDFYSKIDTLQDLIYKLIEIPQFFEND